MRLANISLFILLAACDHDADIQDAAPIIPPLPSLPANPNPSQSQSPSLTPPPTPSQTPTMTDAGACGAKGFPDCPLQAWMKKNMNPPMQAHDWQGMAAALENAATLAPPDYAKTGYVNWVSISHDGANAARAAELDAVKAACRGCHDQYKNKYRAEMRGRVIVSPSP